MFWRGQFEKSTLHEFILRYEVFRFEFEKDVCLPVKYYTPRPEHCLTFYVRDPQRASSIDSPTLITYPQSILYGIQNIPIYRYGGYDFWAIKVVFQPGMLYRLTGIPLQELTNTFIDAEAIWGHAIRDVCTRLNSSDDLAEMLQFVGEFLERLVKRACKNESPVDKAGQYILHQNQQVSLDQLADQSCLSVRQFIRKFDERMGVSPKTYDRIIRFDKAFRMKNKYPTLDWLSIALACGYCDYQHLAKDYKEFTHLTPASFLEMEKATTNRFFGFCEVDDRYVGTADCSRVVSNYR
ncbi:helix-turn-helix domain-containing protein [Larkinella ripae]